MSSSRRVASGSSWGRLDPRSRRGREGLDELGEALFVVGGHSGLHNSTAEPPDFFPRSARGDATGKGEAGDRSRRDERGADRLVVLVAGEEVEDLAAVGEPRPSPRGRRGPRRASPSCRRRRPASTGSTISSREPAALKLVDAEPARQLPDPDDGLVVAELAQVPVRPGEDLLEDLLGVLLAQPVRLAADGVDVAREPRDEPAPASSSPLRQRATIWVDWRDASCTARGGENRNLRRRKILAAPSRVLWRAEEEAQGQHPETHLDYTRTRHSALVGSVPAQASWRPVWPRAAPTSADSSGHGAATSGPSASRRGPPRRRNTLPREGWSPGRGPGLLPTDAVSTPGQGSRQQAWSVFCANLPDPLNPKSMKSSARYDVFVSARWPSG